MLEHSLRSESLVVRLDRLVLGMRTGWGSSAIEHLDLVGHENMSAFGLWSLVMGQRSGTAFVVQWRCVCLELQSFVPCAIDVVW